ncbi:MAG TPA: NAD-dependent epimerase/dehydratase family protein [Acetobacteraceae bacterium]|nr:NAD-dependent epimerase/dehydratase family protein [Acetobacteraceae bacterium]
MDWTGRRVLVTGGAGFLGSNLCHALAARGARVVALDGYLFGGGANPKNLDNAGVEQVRGDVRDIDLRPLCEGADVIFNMAAQTSHMGGQNDPLADIAVNAVAQVRLIQAAREAAPDATVVHASTRQFYGRVTKLPVDENQPVAPPDANGVSKFAGEQYWLLEHRVRGRPVVSLRLTNCYGPRLRIRDARQTFLGIWIRCVLEGRPFEVWGGSQLRDMTYVDDVTEAFLRAAVRPECHGRIFNIRCSPRVAARPGGGCRAPGRPAGALHHPRIPRRPRDHRHRQLSRRRPGIPRRYWVGAGGRARGGHCPHAGLVPAAAGGLSVIVPTPRHREARRAAAIPRPTIRRSSGGGLLRPCGPRNDRRVGHPA